MRAPNFVYLKFNAESSMCVALERAGVETMDDLAYAKACDLIKQEWIDAAKENLSLRDNANGEWSRITALRICCIDNDPNEVMYRVEPNLSHNLVWVPQTIADQVWVYCGFASEADRVAFEEGLPDDVRGMVEPDIISHLHHYGWDSEALRVFPVFKPLVCLSCAKTIRGKKSTHVNL